MEYLCYTRLDGMTGKNRDILRQIARLLNQLESGLDVIGATRNASSLTGTPSSDSDSFHTAAEENLGDEDIVLVALAEDEHERQARLDRITSALVQRRKEQPIEKVSESHDQDLSVDMITLQLQGFKLS